MLRDITIQNYRCFQDFKIEGLARVNPIVGSNNIGKTSFMEAVYLLVNQGDPQSLADLLSNRGEIVPQRPESYQIRNIFYGHQPSFEQKICIMSEGEEARSLQLYLQPLSRLRDPEEIVKPDEAAFEFVFLYGDEKIKFTRFPWVVWVRGCVAF